MCVHKTSIKLFYFVLTETAELVVRCVIGAVTALTSPILAADCHKTARGAFVVTFSFAQSYHYNT